ncbi:MAG TPA: 5-deoxy-glucuronate isomerase, partial [Terriglobia bacterium]|nr:5-deoxy-glucuronate isomerase [Terriglobia bacterium]
MNDLLVKSSGLAGRDGIAGFEYLAFENLKLGAEGRYEGETAGRELAVVVLGGRCSVSSSRGEWRDFGARPHVFGGKPYTLYLPLQTRFEVTTRSGCDLALCYARAEERH